MRKYNFPSHENYRQSFCQASNYILALYENSNKSDNIQNCKEHYEITRIGIKQYLLYYEMP